MFLGLKLLCKTYGFVIYINRANIWHLFTGSFHSSLKYSCVHSFNKSESPVIPIVFFLSVWRNSTITDKFHFIRYVKLLLWNKINPLYVPKIFYQDQDIYPVFTLWFSSLLVLVMWLHIKKHMGKPWEETLDFNLCLLNIGGRNRAVK